MKTLDDWRAGPFAEHTVKPNSGLGQAISYERMAQRFVFQTFYPFGKAELDVVFITAIGEHGLYSSSIPVRRYWQASLPHRGRNPS